MTPSPISPRRTLLVAAILSVAIILTACDGGGRSDPHIAQVQQLQDKLAEEQRRNAEQQRALDEQASSIQRLQGLDPRKRSDELISVARIEIERLSGGYDDNRDGADDGVVVYLRLFDQDGDVIKAAGSASVRLLDLSRPDSPQVVGAGQWSPQQLRPLWYGKILTSHYSLRVPWSASVKAAPAKSITIVVQFVDLLSGRSFETQRAVEVNSQKPPTTPNHSDS